MNPAQTNLWCAFSQYVFSLLLIDMPWVRKYGLRKQMYSFVIAALATGGI
jgi:hypothetical protein